MPVKTETHKASNPQEKTHAQAEAQRGLNKRTEVYAANKQEGKKNNGTLHGSLSKISVLNFTQRTAYQLHTKGNLSIRMHKINAFHFHKKTDLVFLKKKEK